jgi:hypothetical protein
MSDAEAEAATAAGFDAGWYSVALGAFFAMTALMFVTVNIWIAAPYGRHARRGWGFGVAVREAWIIMESPALFVMALVYHTGQFHLLHVPHILLRYLPKFFFGEKIILFYSLAHSCITWSEGFFFPSLLGRVWVA